MNKNIFFPKDWIFFYFLKKHEFCSHFYLLYYHLIFHSFAKLCFKKNYKKGKMFSI